MSSSPKNLLSPAANMKSPNLSTISAFNHGDSSFSTRKKANSSQNNVLTIQIPTEISRNQIVVKPEGSSMSGNKIKIKEKLLLPNLSSPKLVRKSIPAPLTDTSRVFTSPRSPLSPSLLPKTTRVMLSRLQQTVDGWKVSKIGDSPAGSSGRKQSSRSRQGSKNKLPSKTKLGSMHILDELKDPASLTDLGLIPKPPQIQLPLLDSSESEGEENPKPQSPEKSKISKVGVLNQPPVHKLFRVRSHELRLARSTSPAIGDPTRRPATKQSALERTFFKTKLSESEAARLAFMVEQVRRETHDDLNKFTSEFGKRIKDGLGTVVGEQTGNNNWAGGKVVFRVTKKIFKGLVD